MVRFSSTLCCNLCCPEDGEIHLDLPDTRAVILTAVQEYILLFEKLTQIQQGSHCSILGINWKRLLKQDTNTCTIMYL